MVYLVLAGFIGFLAALLYIFARRFRRHTTSSGRLATDTVGESSRKAATNGSRETEIWLKFLGGGAATLTILIAIWQLVDAWRERARTEAQTEYIQATQRLTEEHPSNNMAGIIAMSQLAEDSSERTWQMTESLSAFIRYNFSRLPKPDNNSPTYPPCDARDKEKIDNESGTQSSPPEDGHRVLPDGARCVGIP
jgi:hypothetical protein